MHMNKKHVFTRWLVNDIRKMFCRILTWLSKYYDICVYKFHGDASVMRCFLIRTLQTPLVPCWRCRPLIHSVAFIWNILPIVKAEKKSDVFWLSLEFLSPWLPIEYCLIRIWINFKWMNSSPNEQSSSLSFLSHYIYFFWTLASKKPNPAAIKWPSSDFFSQKKIISIIYIKFLGSFWVLRHDIVLTACCGKRECGMAALRLFHFPGLLQSFFFVIRRDFQTKSIQVICMFQV